MPCLINSCHAKALRGYQQTGYGVEISDDLSTSRHRWRLSSVQNPCWLMTIGVVLSSMIGDCLNMSQFILATPVKKCCSRFRTIQVQDLYMRSLGFVNHWCSSHLAADTPGNSVKSPQDKSRFLMVSPLHRSQYKILSESLLLGLG